MTSRKTLVDQAITFQNPARIPLWFVNADQTAGDAMVYHLSLNRENDSGDNEWGYHLEKLDNGTMGHPTRRICPIGGRPSISPARRSARRIAWPACPPFSTSVMTVTGWPRWI